MTIETGKDQGMAEKINQVVRAVLVTSDGRVGIGRRAPGYEQGKWCLIGGMAETGSLNEELFREIAEETGMPVHKMTDEQTATFVTTIVRHKHGKTWLNSYFVLEIDDLAIPEILRNFNRQEFSEIRFVFPGEVRGMRFAFGDGKIVRSFFRQVVN